MVIGPEHAPGPRRRTSSASLFGTPKIWGCESVVTFHDPKLANEEILRKTTIFQNCKRWPTDETDGPPAPFSCHPMFFDEFERFPETALPKRPNVALRLATICIPFPPLKCWKRIRDSRNRPKHVKGGKGVERKFWNAKFSKVQLCQNMSILRRKLHVFSDCRVADHARPNVTVSFMCRGVFVVVEKFGPQSSRNIGWGENLEIARFSAENCMF